MIKEKIVMYMYQYMYDGEDERRKLLAGFVVFPRISF
jgi:hypothetical protein